jgi:group II intron reverse transcriptase/maturase
VQFAGGVPTALDRLVQEVVRSILNRIYEPTFSNWSHGFRENRSCHTALDTIRNVWTGVKWLVEVDVKGYFDNINHSVLLKLLEKRIDDRKFLSLVDSMLKAGFLDQWVYNETHSGTPQGGIISPLLANVYLHELDTFVEEYIRNFDRGKYRKQDARYSLVSAHVYYSRRKVNQCREAGRDEEATKWLSRYHEYRQQLLRMPTRNPMDPDYRRLRYVRYADDFLLGVIGSKEDARNVMDAVTVFLTDILKLQISSEKSGIRKASKGVQFLGYGIRVFTSSHRMVSTIVKGCPVVKRSMTERIQLSVPREKAQAFAVRHRYGKYDTMHSLARPELLHCDDVEIVKTYNAELRGFANYYALAYDVKRKLAKLALLWSQSFLKTLAHKHQSTVGKMVRKIKVAPGVLVVRQTVRNKMVEAQLWRLVDLERKPIRRPQIDDIPKTESWRYGRSGYVARKTVQQCSHCGTSDGPFNIHHQNPLRTQQKSAPGYKLLKAQRERKTIALCEECHRLQHAGKLPDTRSWKMEAESRVQ